MEQAYIALGANLGEREASLREAIGRIAADADIVVECESKMYETAPVGYTDQPAFLNMAIRVETALAPVALLRRLLAIEHAMGRVREIRWGPRRIDLDLLVYGEVTMDTPELTLPHPRMGQRAFVLVPLRDVWTAEIPFPWQRELNAMSLADEGIAEWMGTSMVEDSGQEEGKECKDNA